MTGQEASWGCSGVRGGGRVLFEGMELGGGVGRGVGVFSLSDERCFHTPSWSSFSDEWLALNGPGV